MREQSLPPDELSAHSLSEGGDGQASHEGSPVLTAGNRSSSLTDVSTYDKDSSTTLQTCRERQSVVQTYSQQQMEKDTPCKSEQQGGESDSSSECSSSYCSPPPLEEESTQLDKKDRPASSELPTPTTTTAARSTSPHTVAMTTVTTSPPTKLATTPHSLHLTPPPPTETAYHHARTSDKENSPFHMYNDEPTLSEQPCTSSVSTQAPLMTFRLPNFFMTPQQLEESMRSLRAGALSRPPPRTHSEHPPRVPSPAQGHRGSVEASHLRTLQEVRAYLESRRTAEKPQSREVSAAETQRLARIFSS